MARSHLAILALFAATTLTRAQSDPPNYLPLLPPNANTGGLALRWANVLSTTSTPLGLAFRAKFDQNASYLWYDMPQTVNASSYDGMFYRVKNVGSAVADFTVELHSPRPDGNSGKFIMGLHLEPGETRRIALWFDEEAAGRPFDLFPPKLDQPCQLFNGGHWNFDRTKVAGFLLWNTTPGGSTVELQDLRLVKKDRNTTGIVDSYGQYTKLDWAGKVTSDADLVTAAATEAATLASQSDVLAPDVTNAFGTSTATGKWRLEKTPSGNWFAVTPQGRRTWIVGLNGANAASGTMIAGRESLFTNVPPKEGVTAQFYNFGPNIFTGYWGNSFDFLGYNLLRKYGSNFKAAWTARTMTRFRKWGINAAVDAVDPSLTAAGLPYVTRIWVWDFPTKLNVPAVAWTPPADPYAPNFRSWLTDRFRDAAADLLANRGNGIGLTVGNEETWGWVSNPATKYQIPTAALNAPMSQPAKGPMLALLKKRYGGSISKLAAAWGTNWTSWAPLEGTNALAFDPNPSATKKADLSALLSAYAQQYFSTIRTALNDIGYKGLWLGSRESMDLVPDEVLDAQSRFVDAHTINLYNLEDANWARVTRLVKPVILSEFSFSAVDRGLSTPDKRFECDNQAERGRRIRAYLDKAAGAKNVVGAWFFQYSDEIVTGRPSDDERMNLGLVDITDTPYPEITGTFRAFALNLPNARRVR